MKISCFAQPALSLRRISLSAILVLVLPFLAVRVPAAVIVSYENPAAPIGGAGYEGQSFTIPSGPSFDHITFSWLAFADGAPMAVGDLFLLSKPYLGSPANLSSATPGFLAHTTTIAQGAYVFSSTLTLSAGNIYWAYMGDDALLSGGGYDNPGKYAGGQTYESFGGATVNYSTTGADVAFRLDGNAVPEPSAAALSLLGLLGIGARRFRPARTFRS